AIGSTPDVSISFSLSMCSRIPSSSSRNCAISASVSLRFARPATYRTSFSVIFTLAPLSWTNDRCCAIPGPRSRRLHREDSLAMLEKPAAVRSGGDDTKLQIIHHAAPDTLFQINQNKTGKRKQLPLPCAILHFHDEAGSHHADR